MDRVDAGIDPAAPTRHAVPDQMTTDPVLIAYTVKRSPKTTRAIWTRIGEAFPHDVGAGLTIVLDSLPLDGRIVLLEPDADDDARKRRELLSKVK